MFENSWVWLAVGVVGLIGFIFGSLIYFAHRARTDSVGAYPFNDPTFVHVGLTPLQQNALYALRLELEFMARIPHHHNRTIDATYYAMTPDEFVRFFSVLSRNVRAMISEASVAARVDGKVFLTGDTFTLSHLMIELAELRARFSPALPAEFALPLKPPEPIDTAPGHA